MESLSARFSIGLTLFGILCLTILALSSRAGAGEPCCGITSLKPRTGVVVAADPVSGRKFEFKVKNAKWFKTLKVGQAVNLNVRTKSVSVSGLPKNCCTLVRIFPGAGTLGPGSLPERYTGPKGGDDIEKAECTDKGGEWRCTVISTGSDPEPGDDTISCHCITH